MTLIRWNPSHSSGRDLLAIQEELNRFADGFFTRSLRSDNGSFAPVVDIEETPEEFVFHLDLPGIQQKDVKVSLLGDTLTVRGERKSEKQEKNNGNALRVERSFGAFERSFTLHAPVRADGVKASYKDGVLEIRVPKADEARLREIEIQVH
jgi:HSP20 family protein